MSTEREALIEEAARAINSVRWNHALPHANRGGVNWTDADLARAAFAVFEQAHTPTDDEPLSLIDAATEAFKRHEDAPTWQDDPVARDAALRWHMRGVEDGIALRRPVQGEPSDAQVDAHAECVCNHGRHTHVRYTGACGLCDCPAVRASSTQTGENR